MITTTRSKALLGGLITVVLVVLTGCAGSPGTEPAGPAGRSHAAVNSHWLDDLKPKKFTWSELNPPDTKWVLGAQDWITKQTNGKVTFENYWSASLVAPTEMLSAAGDGVVDITYSYAGYSPDVLPTAVWLSQFGAQTEANFGTGLIQSTLATNKVWLTNKQLLDEYAKQNVVPFGTYGSQRTPLLCNKPVTNVDQLRGVATRTAGGVWNDEIEALGMTSTFIPLPQLYEGLQRGIVDCAVIAENVVRAQELWDAAKYITPVPFSALMTHVMVMNRDVWNELPPELQDIFVESSLIRAVDYIDDTIARTQDVVLGSGPKEHGIVIENPGNITAAVKQIQAANFAKTRDNPPAKVADPKSLTDDLLGAFDEYKAGLPEGGDEDYLTSIKNAGDLDYSALLVKLREELGLPPR